MRRNTLASSALVGLALLAGCQDNPVAMPSSTAPNLGLQAGETFSYVAITKPTATSKSIAVGTTLQAAATLYYSLGGTTSAVPYGQWRSTNPCVASVTNGPSSWGLITGVSAGEAKIIVEAFGKADTLGVTVTGTGNLNPTCVANEWSWDYTDVSFTGTPASSYFVTGGEKLIKLVLFAGPKPDWTIKVGSKVTLTSELWYNKGGKINGKGYVTFSSSDGAIASINAKGVAFGLAPGRVKIIARLGTSFADTVPLYVKAP